jgi:hypothetical protein
MNKLTLILTLFFSTMFASPAYADWEAVALDEDGRTFYVDFDRIRTNGGYVYYWELQDYSKLYSKAKMSFENYFQGDCEMFRLKWLTSIIYKQPMGEGSGETYSVPDNEWTYLSPNSSQETVLKQVCRRAGL